MITCLQEGQTNTSNKLLEVPQQRYYNHNMNNKNNQDMVNMVLTSIVNNETILNSIVHDIGNRFDVRLSSDKLEKFLSTVTLTPEKNEFILV